MQPSGPTDVATTPRHCDVHQGNRNCVGIRYPLHPHPGGLGQAYIVWGQEDHRHYATAVVGGI